jgi:hypothetical protein
MAVSPFVWVPFILQAGLSLEEDVDIGAVVLLFFVILAGVRDSVPLNETFFLSADISSFKSNVNTPSGISSDGMSDKKATDNGRSGVSVVQRLMG